MKKIIAIVGPTASGKTKLAIAVAKHFAAVIISCDSVAVYKDYNIGSAKPTKAELKEVKHYLVDVLEPTDNFDVATCQKLARDIINKEELCILCGGTGLYVNAILNDYEFVAPKRDENFAANYANFSNQELYELLKIHDEERARNLHPNNRKRVLRALEACYSGNKLSNYNNKSVTIYDSYIVYLDIPREILYERINLRVEEMFKMGLEKEAYDLYQRGVLPNAIGYKEFIPYFNNLISLDMVKEDIKLNTRHLAKRQKTWFKNQTKAVFYDATNYEKLTKDVICDLEKFMEKK